MLFFNNKKTVLLEYIARYYYSVIVLTAVHMEPSPLQSSKLRFAATTTMYSAWGAQVEGLKPSAFLYPGVAIDINLLVAIHLILTTDTNN